MGRQSIGVLSLLLALLTGARAFAEQGNNKLLLPPPIKDEDIKKRAELWVRKLGYAPNPDEAAYCRENIVALGSKAIATVIEEVDADKRKMPMLHWNACLLLGKMGDDTAMRYLLKRLEPVTDRDQKAQPEWTYVRAYAALALGKIKDPAKQALVPLRKVAKDKDESSFLRRCAMLALGTLRDEESVPFFKERLFDTEEKSLMRCAAALALGMMDTQGQAAPVLMAYLKEKVKDRDPTADRLAVQALGMLRKEDTAPALRLLLNNEDFSLVGSVALTLAYMNDRDAAPAIEALQKDATIPAFARCNLSVALNNLGKPEVGSPYLREILEGKEKSASVGTLAYAAVALGDVSGDENLIALYNAVKKDENPVVTLNAINSLGHRKDPRMVDVVLIPKFTDAKGSRNEFLRGEIVRALQSHSERQAIRALFIKGLSDASAYVRGKCAVALARYPGGDVEQALVEALADKEYEIRGEAALSLGILKSKQSAGALWKMLDDDSDWVRFRVRKALENIITYGDSEFTNVAGIKDMAVSRIKRVGCSLKDEMDRMYTEAYQLVLELDKPYRPNRKVW